MTGHRKLKLQVKISTSPATASKQYPPFPSTTLKSPIAGPRKRRVHANRDDPDKDVHHPYSAPGDSVVQGSEDEEYFEPPLSTGEKRVASSAGLGIHVDAVNNAGKYIIPIVTRYSKNYDDVMSGQEDRDLDKNYQTVIDLWSDDNEEGLWFDDPEEEAIFQVEQ